MSLIDKLIAMKPNVTQLTLKAYVDKLLILRDYVLKKQNKKVSVERPQLTLKDLKLLSNTDLIDELVKDKKPLTQKTYYVAFSVLSQLEKDKYKKQIEYYVKKSKEIQEKYDEYVNENHKTYKQESNWMSVKDLQTFINKKFDDIDAMNLLDKSTITRAEFKKVQLWFVGSLYVGDVEDHPPVRADYAPMDIIEKPEYDKIKPKSDEEYKNYLVIAEDGEPLHFHFGEYKSFKIHGITINKISNVMKPIIEYYLNIRDKLLDAQDTQSLLLNRFFKPMTENGLVKYVSLVFKDTKKKITITLLRHIIISEVRDVVKEKKIASKMMHSVKQQGEYSKAT